MPSPKRIIANQIKDNTLREFLAVKTFPITYCTFATSSWNEMMMLVKLSKYTFWSELWLGKGQKLTNYYGYLR